MNGISSSFVGQNGVADNVKAFEAFTYKVLKDATTTQTATPAVPMNGFQYINCVDCPILLTFKIQPATPKGAETAPEATEHKVCVKAFEAFSLSFGGDCVTEVTIDQAPVAPDDALTADDDAEPVTTAGIDLEGKLRFYNS